MNVVIEGRKWDLPARLQLFANTAFSASLLLASIGLLLLGARSETKPRVAGGAHLPPVAPRPVAPAESVLTYVIAASEGQRDFLQRENNELILWRQENFLIEPAAEVYYLALSTDESVRLFQGELLALERALPGVVYRIVDLRP